MKIFFSTPFQIIILLVLTPFTISAQGKHANSRYFDEIAGITYNTGSHPDQAQGSEELAGYGAMQLTPDGKIYITSSGNSPGVLHNPHLSGVSCYAESDVIDFESLNFRMNLPGLKQSYLRDYSFAATQNCSGLPTFFTIENTEGIDSVFWNFNDNGNFGNDTSTLLNPSYTFSSSGTFYPELSVYSDNLQYTVTGTVLIYQSPAPSLGNDTMFCPDDPINLTLDAGPGEQYYWNGNTSAGQPTFQVTDTGTYTVRVMDNGCSGYDTIHVSQYPEPIIDDTYLVVVNANCGYSDGSITGIALNSGYLYNVQWKDNADNVVGTDLDLVNIPAGLYYLQVRYGENCLISSGPYTVIDIGAPLISHIEVFHDFCNMGTGAITVIPETGDPDEYWYSVNGGIEFIQNEGYFTGLHIGIYSVMIRNEAGCISSPFIIEVASVSGALIIQIQAMPDYCDMNTGTIRIVPAPGNPNEYWYSLNGGLDFIQNEGYFTGLPSGDYSVMIRHVSGCLSNTFPVLVAGIPCPENVIGFPDLTNTPSAEGMAIIVPPGGGPYAVEVDGNMQTIVNDTITGLSEGSHSITITNGYGITLSISLYIEGILGLDEAEDVGSFTLYQDGSSKIIYLDSGTNAISEKAYAEIRNISGQLIGSLPINKSRTEINLDALSKGMYIISIITDKGRQSVKVLK
jgi:PKD repeat protein